MAKKKKPARYVVKRKAPAVKRKAPAIKQKAPVVKRKAPEVKLTIAIKKPTVKRKNVPAKKQAMKATVSRLKKNSENWLQKSKLISSALQYAGMTNPVANFGMQFAKYHGYGKGRNRTVHPYFSRSSAVNVGGTSRWDKIKNTAYKYRVPLIATAGYVAKKIISNRMGDNEGNLEYIADIIPGGYSI